jgi:hypothetical protein
MKIEIDDMELEGPAHNRRKAELSSNDTADAELRSQTDAIPYSPESLETPHELSVHGVD